MNCEDFLIQKFALLDGEKPGIPAGEINAHLAACENCRREIEQTESAVLMFENQQRNLPEADLWAAIEKRIGAPPKTAFTVGWQPFAVVGALLAAIKLLEMIPERDIGWIIKLAPFAIVVLLFGILKENPFKINTELIPEK
jgi:predicted anti-sigma-YlaC factor YlaD